MLHIYINAKILGKTSDFEQFYKKSYRSLFLQAFHLIGDEEICRDLVAECFEYLWKNNWLLAEKNILAYIKQMLKNKCIDYLKHEEVKAKYISFYKYMADTTNEDFQDERMEKIYKVVEGMKPPTGNILKEVFFNKKKYKEVAAEMNISTSTVKKHIIKALKEIRSAVKK